jgi:hypothetical protein
MRDKENLSPSLCHPHHELAIAAYALTNRRTTICSAIVGLQSTDYSGILNPGAQARCPLA